MFLKFSREALRHPEVLSRFNCPAGDVSAAKGRGQKQLGQWQPSATTPLRHHTDAARDDGHGKAAPYTHRSPCDRVPAAGQTANDAGPRDYGRKLDKAAWRRTLHAHDREVGA